MKITCVDKFEYKYTPLASSWQRSIEILNEFGKDGWEVIELIKGSGAGSQNKAILKRKITEATV